MSNTWNCGGFLLHIFCFVLFCFHNQPNTRVSNFIYTDTWTWTWTIMIHWGQGKNVGLITIRPTFLFRPQWIIMGPLQCIGIGGERHAWYVNCLKLLCLLSSYELYFYQVLPECKFQWTAKFYSNSPPSSIQSDDSLPQGDWFNPSLFQSTNYKGSHGCLNLRHQCTRIIISMA